MNQSFTLWPAWRTERASRVWVGNRIRDWWMWLHVLAAVGSALNPRLGPIQSVTLCEGDSPMVLNCPGAGYDLYLERSTVFWGRRDSSTCAPASSGKNLEMCEGSSEAVDQVRQKNTIDLYGIFWKSLLSWSQFFITGGTIGCRYDNPRCHQRRQSWHLDNSRVYRCMSHQIFTLTLIAKFMGPTWGPPGSFWPQMGPMLAPWTLLSGLFCYD